MEISLLRVLVITARWLFYIKYSTYVKAECTPTTTPDCHIALSLFEILTEVSVSLFLEEEECKVGKK